MATIQRGSGWSIKLVFTLYKLFGYRFTYYLMYPVTFFYFLFASNVQRDLRVYYQKLDIAFTKKVYYKHLFMFAMCMVDRFISKADCISYDFKYNNKEMLKQRVDNGSILLLSHFGGWSVTNCKTLSDNTINIVMKEVILESIKKIEDSIVNSVENIKIIDQGVSALEVSIKIANAISNKESIAFMGDRAIDDKNLIKIEFLNELASFNANPFRVAHRTKTPLCMIFVLHSGLQQYHIISKDIYMDYVKTEKDAVLESMREYVKELESMVKKYPNQWFNLYDFWKK